MVPDWSGVPNRKILIILILILIGIPGILGYQYWQSQQPYRVGVLLPGSGDNAMGFFEVLEWTADGLNEEGVGREIELVCVDTATVPFTDAARQMLDDPSIRVIIGPASSDETIQLAPECIRAKKILITPSATAGDISRMFSQYGYIWRTTAGDRIQTRIMMNLLSERGAMNVSLLYENSTYGQTFYDWAGFYAVETGINLTGLVPFEAGGDLFGPVSEASAGDPDYIIVISRGSDAAKITKIVHDEGIPSQLLFSDAARSSNFPELGGPDAEGAEGLSPTADKSTGFFVAYKEHFGVLPSDYAAYTRDALILAVASLARLDAAPFETPSDAFMQVISGRDYPASWDDQGAATAIRMIRDGKFPDLSGASGPLDYDPDQGVDPLVTWYVNWRIEDGEFHPASYISGISGTKQEHDLQSIPVKEPELVQKREGDLYAVIVTTSTSWDNYRHQADAAYMYHLLTGNNVPRDNIILISPEDVPVSDENPIQGDLHHTPGGENVYEPGISVTRVPHLTPEAFVSFLLGDKTEEIPVQLQSNETSTLLLYIVGHAGQGYFDFSNGDLLDKKQFHETIQKMADKKMFSHLLIVADTCFGEEMGAGLDVPGVIFMTGASSDEPSKGAEYDISIRQWLSDDFTKSLTEVLRENPDVTLKELYELTYERVSGSHARIIATNQYDLNLQSMEFFSA